MLHELTLSPVPQSLSQTLVSTSPAGGGQSRPTGRPNCDLDGDTSGEMTAVALQVVWLQRELFHEVLPCLLNLWMVTQRVSRNGRALFIQQSVNTAESC